MEVGEGFAPIFWRWPEKFHAAVQDSFPGWFLSVPRLTQRPLSASQDMCTSRQVVNKLENVLKKDYTPPPTVA